jgi:hypothetical protein
MFHAHALRLIRVRIFKLIARAAFRAKSFAGGSKGAQALDS